MAPIWDGATSTAIQVHGYHRLVQRTGWLLVGVRLIHHGRLAAALAGDPQEPGREGSQRQIQRPPCGGQRLGAVVAPVTLGRRLEAAHGRSSCSSSSRSSSDLEATWSSSAWTKASSAAYRAETGRSLDVAEHRVGSIPAAPVL